MRNNGLVVVVLLLVVAGCFDSVRSRRDTSPAEPPITSAAKATTESRGEDPATPKEDPKQRRTELEKRLRAAVELDGHPQGWQMVEAVSDCKAGGPKCVTTITKVQGISETCFFAGKALRFLRDGDLDAAESKLVHVEEFAKEWGPKRKRAMEQQKATVAAAEECERNRAPCKTRCDQKDDLPACIAYGVALYTEDKKYAEAKPYLKRACDADFGPACNLLKDVDKVEAEEQKNATAKVDAAWSSLRTIGDDLATKKFLHAFAAANLKGARNARATQNMSAHIASITRDDFCPAMKEFLAVSTRADLAKRAKAHCDDDPPTATGLAGKEEILTAECRAVYATTCP